MKRYLALVILAVLVIIPFAMPISNESARAEQTLDGVVDSTLDGVDFSGYDDLIRLLDEYNDYSFGKSAKQLVEDIIDGKADLSFSYFFDLIVNMLGGEVKNLLPQIALIIIISILFGVLNNLNSGFLNANTQKIVYLACYGLIVTLVGYMFIRTITYAREIFSFLDKFVSVSFPVMITLITAMGASATVAVYQPYIMTFSVVLVKLVNVVIMPLFYATFIFGVIGNLSDSIKLNKISAVTKSIAEWVIGIVFGTFMTLLTAQGITGASIDGLALRGTKFALSSYVPIIGSYIKDGFDIVVAGCMVIKNAIGLCALFILLAGILIPIVRILITSFSLKIASAITEPITDVKISTMLYTAGASLKVVVVAIIAMGLAMLIGIMLIIYTCNPGVL